MSAAAPQRPDWIQRADVWRWKLTCARNASWHAEIQQAVEEFYAANPPMGPHHRDHRLAHDPRLSTPWLPRTNNKQENKIMREKIMVAFHGDEKTKEFFVNRVMAHRAADEICSGFYWQNGKGLRSRPCTVHSNDHAAYEREMGIPRVLAFIEDTIFENLCSLHASPDVAKLWPERFISPRRGSVPIFRLSGRKFRALAVGRS